MSIGTVANIALEVLNVAFDSVQAIGMWLELLLIEIGVELKYFIGGLLVTGYTALPSNHDCDWGFTRITIEPPSMEKM